MKKKTKLIGAVFALCTSLCMLCFGVMAASSVSLNVSSTVSFSAQGVYLKAQGQVKRGANTGSLSNLVGDTYSYTGYSYNPDENGAPDGTAYTQTAMRDDAGSTSGWNIGKVEFTENEKVLQYEIVFTNYSEFDVEITITPTTAGTLTNVTTSSQTAEKVTVSAKSGQTPGTKTYTFTMTLNNVATSQSGTVGLDISAVKYEIHLYNVTVESGKYYVLETSETPILSDGEPFQYGGKMLVFCYLTNPSMNPFDQWQNSEANNVLMGGYIDHHDRGSPYELSVTVNNVIVFSETGEDGDFGPLYAVGVVLNIQNDSNVEIVG